MNINPAWVPNIITAAATLTGVAITGGLAVLTAYFNNRHSRKMASSQLDRDLAKHRETLRVEELKRVYGMLATWVASVADTTDDICFDADLKDLPAAKRTWYDICVHMHKTSLRLPPEAAGGRHLWSSEVSKLVYDLQQQAVTMAHATIVEGHAEGEEHGHDRLEALAHEIYYAMKAELFPPTARKS